MFHVGDVYFLDEFVRSGWAPERGGLSDATGRVNVNWSSAVSNANTAYYFDFGSQNINPRANIVRYFGFSLRCLVR